MHERDDQLRENVDVDVLSPHGVDELRAEIAGKIEATLRAPHYPEAKALTAIFETADEGLMQNVELVEFPQGAVLVEQGKKNDFVYVAITGSGIFSVKDEPTGQIVALRSTPTVIGEISLTHDTDQIASKTVTVESGTIHAYKIPREIFVQLYNTNDDFKRPVEYIAQERLADMRQQSKMLPLNEGVDLLKQSGIEKIPEIGPALLKAIEAKPELVDEIPEAFTRLQLAEGDTLITQTPWDKVQHQSNHIYVIIKGEADIVTEPPAENGAKTLVYMGSRGPGSPLGEMAAFSKDGRRAATVRAKTPLTVLRIDEVYFHDLLQIFPQLRGSIAKLVEQRRSQNTNYQESAIVAPVQPQLPEDLQGIFAQEVMDDPVRRDAEIRRLNTEHRLKPPYKHLAYQVIGRTKEGVVTADEHGKLMFLPINKENATDVLKQLRIALNETTNKNVQSDGYGVRQVCVQMCPKLQAGVAYSISEKAVPAANRDALRAAYKNKSNFLPKRREIQERLTQWMREKIQKGHEQMKASIAEHLPEIGDRPVMVVMRGNTAAGKSSTVRKPPESAERLRKFGIDPACAINPDEIKAELGELERYNGVKSVISPQFHIEGSILTEGLIEEALTAGQNMVIDKRFLTPGDIKEVTDEAKAKGYYVVVIDVDAEKQTSLDRVYGNSQKGIAGRDPNGRDPIPIPSVVEDGHQDAVLNRAAIARDVSIGDEYYFFKTDPKEADPEREFSGDGAVQIAQRIGNTDIKVFDEKLYKHTTLEKKDYFVKDALRVFLKTSRTAQGTIDTSATPEKAKEMKAGSGAETAVIAQRNLQQAMEKLYDERDRNFASPDDVKAWVVEISCILGKDILKDEALNEEGILRTDDGPKYAPANQLRQLFGGFCAELFERLQKGVKDPVELAAWIEFKVNVTDHYLKDGCGKLSKALAMWALLRGKYGIPKYPDNKKYFNGQQYVTADQEPAELAKWIEHYRTFAPKKS
jgi:CRP-like cAMP-binding protein